MRSEIRWLFLFVLYLLIPGTMAIDCGGTPIGDAKQFLYVLDNSNDAVYVFEGINTIDGPQDPVRTLTGDDTLIENPTAIAVDTLRDTLYVADATQSQILIFPQASTLDGNVAPLRSLPVEGNPQLMALDQTRNLLFVYNVTDQTILLWENVNNLDGDVPTQSFEVQVVASAMFYDTQRDLLYVGDPLGFTILVFDQASRSIGTPVPAAAWVRGDGDPDDGVIPDFERIDSLAMNIDNNIMFVSESLDQAVEMYDNASTLNEAVLPDRTLSGDMTQLTDEMRSSLFHENVFYQTNTQTTLAIWDNANTLDGNTAPNRVITVNPATRIRGFAIDLTR